jgi:hypothetical protein
VYRATAFRDFEGVLAYRRRRAVRADPLDLQPVVAGREEGGGEGDHQGFEGVRVQARLPEDGVAAAQDRRAVRGESGAWAGADVDRERQGVARPREIDHRRLPLVAAQQGEEEDGGVGQRRGEAARAIGGCRRRGWGGLGLRQPGLAGGEPARQLPAALLLRRDARL